MPEISPEEFKKGMRHLAAAVNVVSVIKDAQPRGMLATAVCSVSADPPSLLVCVNKSASMRQAIEAAGRFCVSVLDARQFSTACHFMSSSADERFTACEWDILSTGSPAIQDALVNFDCEVDTTVDVSTHAIFIGRIVAMRCTDEGQPLMYHNGHYAALDEMPLQRDR